MEKAQT